VLVLIPTLCPKELQAGVASKAGAVPKGEHFFFDQKLITGRDSCLYWLLRFGVLVGTDRHSELRFRDLA
jgi:hypothetical protein